MKRKHVHDNSGAVADPAGSYHMPKGIRRLAAIIFLSALIGGSTLFPTSVFSKTLDEAVDEQLAASGTKACNILLDGGSSSVLTGSLKSICDRTILASSFPFSNTSGGGAGTPTTLPGIVKERMEGEEDDDEDSGVMELGGGLSFFFSAEYEEIDREATTFEAGYDSNITRFTLGVDYRVSNRFVAGMALDASRHKGDFLGVGNFKNESKGVILFSDFLPTDRSFLQAYGGYALMSNERERLAVFREVYISAPPFTATGTPEANFDADQYSVGLLAGYDLPLGALTIGPRAGIDWSRIEYDTYSETNGEGLSGLELTFHDDEEKSLLTTLGLTASITGSTNFGVVVAQQSIYWKHQFNQDQRDVEVSFVGDTRAKRFTYKTEAPDQSFFEFNAGFSVILPKGIQAFVNFRTLFGHEFLKSHAGTIGLRYEK